MNNVGRWTTASRLFAITIALLLFGSTMQHQFGHYPRTNVDFNVYYFAASILHDNHGGDIYYSDLEGNPQQRNAPEDSPIFKKAQAAGIPWVMLYLYPPLTADLFIPLTRLSEQKATVLWQFLNVCMVFVSVVLLSRLIGVRLWSAEFVVFVMAAYAFFPVVEALLVGQIAILMLVLWAISVLSYRRGYTVLSACALAFATTLKVTPLLAVPLFFIWNERKWLAAYFGTVAALIAGMAIFNGPRLLATAVKVLGAMGGSLPTLHNKCISAVVEWIYFGQFFKETEMIAEPPHMLALVAKVITMIFYFTCLVLVVRRYRKTDAVRKTLVFATFAIVSVLSSPIAWRHAYAVILVPLALLWVQALRTRTPAFRPLLLALTTCVVGSPALDLVATLHIPWPLRMFVGAIWMVCNVLLCLDVLGRGFAADPQDAVDVFEPVAA